jgi:hypothetical protein
LWQRQRSQRSSNKSFTFRFALWHSNICFILIVDFLTLFFFFGHSHD